MLERDTECNHVYEIKLAFHLPRAVQDATARRRQELMNWKHCIKEDGHPSSMSLSQIFLLHTLSKSAVISSRLIVRCLLFDCRIRLSMQNKCSMQPIFVL